jgi:hypothetical protein
MRLTSAVRLWQRRLNDARFAARVNPKSAIVGKSFTMLLPTVRRVRNTFVDCRICPFT